ncbi:LLM class flavin-dependent oxidoreductase [Streptomyces sp. NPDC005132]|uniref:LLM class flavin-dependent oxidoreductase n=1 Tax=Streptomyces sp. NPDC005132 TaxID=3154294 RepID=UPI0033BBED6B
MVQIGYTMMTEQAGPRELVGHVVGAERAGFDFSVTSDHYFPWLESQGHAPYAWSVLGAAAQATERIPLMTYVTCPTTRYHSAGIAQKAATMQLLSQGVSASGSAPGRTSTSTWSAADGLPRMCDWRCWRIIRSLFSGEDVSHHGPQMPPGSGSSSSPASC